MRTTSRTLFISLGLTVAACGPLPEGASDMTGERDVTVVPPSSDPAMVEAAYPNMETPVLRMLLTDAPLDGVDQVNVTFDRVEVQHSMAGWTTVTSSVQTFDLLALQNGVTADLGLTSLSTGTYSQIRMHLTDAWLVIDEEPVDLFVPSGEQSGLKIPHDFTIEPGSQTDIVIDFDAGESVHQRGNGEWIMRPVLKVVGSSTTAREAVDVPEERPEDRGPPADAGRPDDRGRPDRG